jgi:hypothetical protein
MVLVSGTRKAMEAMTFCIHEMEGGILVEGADVWSGMEIQSMIMA